MRKEFLLRLICFLTTILMAVMSCFPIGWYYVVYTDPNEIAGCHMPYYTHVFDFYKIIIFFCICIVMFNLMNKMKWMWMCSIGLLLSYTLIRQIDFFNRLSHKMDYAARGAQVTEMSYHSLDNSVLLTLYCVLIFIISTILFIIEKREKQRIAALMEMRRRAEKLKEDRMDEEWRKSLFNQELLLDNFPLDKIE